MAEEDETTKDNSAVKEDIAPPADNPNESIYEKSLKLKDEMKEQLDRREELIAREEKLAAHNMLGGTSDAGQASPVKVKEDLGAYAAQALAGELNTSNQE